MATPNRAALLTKAHKVLKKHYQAVAAISDRTLFEHLLYACCLENAQYDAADEAFAKLQETYFDWNEVRVTTVAELAEVMSPLTDATAAASRLKRALQSVFESEYSFDLEFLKKQNIGKSVKKLEKYDGVSPFTIAYVTQAALGGHAIAVDDATLEVLFAVGVITETEHAKKQVPGLERAIPKTKGVEFGSLLHQLAADLKASPFGSKVRGIVVEIAPEAKDRLPKRAPKKTRSKKGEKKTAAAKKAPGKKKATKKAAAKKKAKAPAAKKAVNGKKKSATKRLSRKKPR